MQTLSQGVPRSLLSSSFPLDPSMSGQREPRGLAHGTGSPLIQWVGFVSPEFAIHCSPISKGSHSLWCPGSGLQFLPLDGGSLVNDNKMGGAYKLQMVPDTNHLNEFHVLFVFTNIVPLKYSIIRE